MALARQITSIPFAGGINTKVDKWQTPLQQLQVAQNVVFSRPGEVQPRFGYQALNNSYQKGTEQGTISDGRALMAYDRELVLCDPFALYSWDAGQQTFVWKSRCTSMNLTAEEVRDNTYAQQAADENIAPNGTRFDAWEDSTGTGGVWYSVTDGNTGQPIVPPTQVLDTGCKPKVLVLGSIFCLIYLDGGSGKLHLATLGSVGPFSPLSDNAITAGSADPTNQLNASFPTFDACVMQTAGGLQLFLAFANSESPDFGVTIFAFNQGSYTTPVNTTDYADIEPHVIGLFPDTTAGVAYLNNGPVLLVQGANLSNQVQAQGFTQTLQGVTFTATVETTTNRISNMTGVSVGGASTTRSLAIFYTFLLSTPAVSLVRYQTITGTTPGTAATLRRGVGLVSKAFVLSATTATTAYVTLAYQSKIPPSPGFNGRQNTYFVVDQTGYTAARFFEGTGGGFPPFGGIGANPISVYGFGNLCEVYPVPGSTTQFSCALEQCDSLTTFATTTPVPIAASTSGDPSTAPVVPAAVYTAFGVTSVTYDFFDPQASYSRTVLGNVLCLGGGLLQQYDGQQLTEIGFNLYPENMTADGTTSGSIPAGTYFYAVVYQWVNGEGALEQSAPGLISVDITGGAATLTIPTLRMTAKSGVTIIVYRSVLTGTVYQQCLTTTQPAASGATNAPILNDPTVDTVTFVDQMLDATLASNPNLYTTGNVIENLPTGPCSAVTTNYNRLFALSSLDPLLVAFSQQAVPTQGTPGQPVQMSAWLEFNVDPRGGNVTTIYAMDQHLVCAKETLLMAVDGIGPDATGNQGNFNDAYIINVDGGCIYPRSLGLVPDGLYFQSAKGVQVLNRYSLALEYVGAPPQELINQYQITSVQLLPYTQQIRLTVDQGYAVVHDYYVKQWAQHTGIAAVDSAIWQDQYAYLQSNGVVMVETPGSPPGNINNPSLGTLAAYADNGKWIPGQLVTPHYDFAKLNGWQRIWWVYLLLKIRSACLLTVEARYDYTGGWVDYEEFPLDPGEIYGALAYGVGDYGGDPPEFQLPFQPSQQLSSAMQLRFTMSQNGNPVGPGLSFSGISFEWGRQDTLRRGYRGAG